MGFKQVVEMPEDGLPLTHTYSEGVYAREIFMPAGMIVVGHVHRTRHLNIVSSGKAKVYHDGVLEYIEAPYTFESMPGVQKVLYIEEDMFWTTIHVTNETDQEKLDILLVDKSASEGKDFRELIEMARDNLLIGE